VIKVPGTKGGHLNTGGQYDPDTNEYKSCSEIQAEKAALAEESAFDAKAKAYEDARERADDQKCKNDDFILKEDGILTGDTDPAYNKDGSDGSGEEVPADNPSVENGMPDEEP
jgi:hypothetical protein